MCDIMTIGSMVKESGISAKAFRSIINLRNENLRKPILEKKMTQLFATQFCSIDKAKLHDQIRHVFNFNRSVHFTDHFVGSLLCRFWDTSIEVIANLVVAAYKRNTRTGKDRYLSSIGIYVVYEPKDRVFISIYNKY